MNVIEFPIESLVEHPSQPEIFGDLGGIEYERLKDDIAENGQRTPIDVNEDGLILDGHQRVRVLRDLGHETVLAVVREEMSEDDQTEFFLRANFNRRQLDPIQKARVIYEIAKHQARRERNHGNILRSPEFREKLAEELGGGMSGRTISRHLQLLRLPPVIQDAVSSRVLPMTFGLRIEALSKSEQLQIAERIADGEPPRAVAQEYFAPVEPPDPPDEEDEEDEDSIEEWYGYCVGLLNDLLPLFEEEVESLAGAAGEHATTAATLRRASEFCAKMAERETRAKEDSFEKLRALLDEDQEWDALSDTDGG